MARMRHGRLGHGSSSRDSRIELVELSGPAHPATAVVGGQRQAWKTKRRASALLEPGLGEGVRRYRAPGRALAGHLSDAATVTADRRPTEVGRWSLAPFLRSSWVAGVDRASGAVPWPCPRRRRRDDRGLPLPLSWGSPVWPWRCSRAMVTARAIPPPTPRPPARVTKALQVPLYDCAATSVASSIA